MNTHTASVMKSRMARRIQRILTAAALGTGLVVWGAAPADASELLGAGGTIGYVYGDGATVCNPFISSGFARNLVDIGGPLVAETRAYVPPGTVSIGGGQRVLWQPSLEKHVNGAWVKVWTGRWYERNNQTQNFETVFVDVRYLSRYPGAGYFRTGGTVQWIADSSHAGGWIQYRHSAGNYFKDAWANFYVAKSTPVSTPYCYAGQ